MFQRSFYVKNKTELEIHITPIGTYKHSQDYYPLPLRYWDYPPLPKIKLAEIVIKPDEIRKFHYDGDDIDCKGFVVKTSKLKKLIQKDVYSSDTVLISSLVELPNIDRELENRLRKYTYRYWYYIVIVFGLINILVFIRSNKLRKLKKNGT